MRTRRLARLTPDLWVDMDSIVSVRTYSEMATYRRNIEIKTCHGDTWIIPVPGTGDPSRTVGQNDVKVRVWLEENLPTVIERGDP